MLASRAPSITRVVRRGETGRRSLVRSAAGFVACALLVLAAAVPSRAVSGRCRVPVRGVGALALVRGVLVDLGPGEEREEVPQGDLIDVQASRQKLDSHAKIFPN